MLNLIHPKEEEKVQAAQNEVIRGQKKPTIGRVIAELSFGFWTSLLHARYKQRLWPRLTKRVFPYAPKSAQYRKTLFERLDRIRRLRNRAFHHEPILKGIQLHKKHHPLEILHAETRESIQWLRINSLGESIALQTFAKCLLRLSDERSARSKSWRCGGLSWFIAAISQQTSAATNP